MDKNLTRFSAHFDSEIGLLRKEYERANIRLERMHKTLYGENGHSISIRMDRLEQSEKSREKQHKVMWGGVATALAPYVQKLITLLTAA